jgi:hypothetical protein
MAPIKVAATIDLPTHIVVIEDSDIPNKTKPPRPSPRSMIAKIIEIHNFAFWDTFAPILNEIDIFNTSNLLMTYSRHRNKG